MVNPLPDAIPPDVAPLEVAVGLVRDAYGRLLLSYRSAGRFYSEYWEFPGGKREAGEDSAAALRRELAEEIGITVTQARLWREFNYHYPERWVRLFVWEVQGYEGVPWGREQQPLVWVTLEELAHYRVLPANRHLINALCLPAEYCITPPEVGADFSARLERVLATGVRLVQLRTPGLPEAVQAALTEQALDRCHQVGAQLLVNAAPERARRLGADGVHLSSRRLLALETRPPGLRWVAASCHTLPELAQALAVGVDFIVLGPVLATSSHPDAQPLGWEQFGAWAGAQPLPVYALGGLTRQHLPQALTAGAQGIAAIRGLWRD